MNSKSKQTGSKFSKYLRCFDDDYWFSDYSKLELAVSSQQLYEYQPRQFEFKSKRHAAVHWKSHDDGSQHSYASSVNPLVDEY